MVFPSRVCDQHTLRSVVLIERYSKLPPYTQRWYHLGFSPVIELDRPPTGFDDAYAVDFRSELNILRHYMEIEDNPLHIHLDLYTEKDFIAKLQPIGICVPIMHKDSVVFVPAGICNKETFLKRRPFSVTYRQD